ncbi:23S rRNA (adenine(1618)-N(6))-methyltransferase RlmF [Myroides sp. JBRI-B21084]|uniref:23S rRNA (adenine(1618)-N(6))-methyltransferase RlmF n=1 Tax=Myroides sp. JBRI-B21084 TaxID=3119977 RepID=UPI0026E21B1B|nr:23S rRNA (adenine(1618)-N(6))-methyltransferase RlmF [Paenimyroides cloacae]WKW45449.1 23S rRNA (adenine(1618)-N(6))-methyltransferase RlmF [Paenimyroides cloacae]
MHSNNLHNKPYNFKELIIKVPELSPFIVKNKMGIDTVLFANQQAVYYLNKALLLCFYGLDYWDIPKENLVPPVPGRADYLHYLSEIIPNTSKTTILDIGTGASLIYPLIGHALFNWNFVATDIDSKSIQNAQQIINNNKHLSLNIFLREQSKQNQILKGIINDTDFFDAVICNPPFFKSKKEADTQTLRKLKGLNNTRNVKLAHNFSGKNNELWCEGGELVFVKKLINESLLFTKNVGCFTVLISNENNLKPLQNMLQNKVKYLKIMEMSQGNKKSRILAWRFQ